MDKRRSLVTSGEPAGALRFPDMELSTLGLEYWR